MTKPIDEKKFFIIKKEKYSWATNYSIHDRTMYTLTNAVRKLLALDTLNEDREQISYHSLFYIRLGQCQNKSLTYDLV